jgi:hypothetical protein
MGPKSEHAVNSTRFSIKRNLLSYSETKRRCLDNFTRGDNSDDEMNAGKMRLVVLVLSFEKTMGQRSVVK